MTNATTIKTQPHNTEAEQTVIGALLLDPEAIFKIDAKLAASDFYDPVYRDIYAAIRQLSEKGTPIDFVTVADSLKDNERVQAVGGSVFLSRLASDVPTSSHITQYADMVHDRSRRRQLITVGKRMESLGHTDKQSADELIELAEQEFLKVARQASNNEPCSLADLRAERFDHYVNLYESEDPTQFCALPTGFPAIDKKLCGLSAGQLIVLAGRPGMGKTAFALDIASHVAGSQGKNVLVCSLEMSKEELFGRLLAKRLGIESWKLERGAITDSDFAKMGSVMDDLGQPPLYIDDDTDTTLINIRSKARCHQMRHGLDLLVIDYLQLIEVTDKIAGENQTQRVSYITKTLKQLARELQCPVLLLSQLSRECEKRVDKRPIPSDLRDSGSIEQDADKILMLYRESEYNEDCDNPNLTEVLIRKNRHGPKGCVELHFTHEKMSFVNRNDSAPL
jgi:replicative DNA helicase